MPLYWFTAGTWGGDLGLNKWWLLPVAAPLAVVLLQWIYPSLLGWGIIFLLTVLFIGYLVCAVISNIRAGVDSGSDWYSFLIYVGVLIGEGVALFIARPKLNEKPKVAAGSCAACGYDLRATPDRCPECGVIPPPTGP
jgi:hypothetical protein